MTDTTPPEFLHLAPLSNNTFLNIADVEAGLAPGTSPVPLSSGLSAASYDVTSIELRTTVVPLPAGGVLLVTALGAAAVARRRSGA